jgi:hypothetical protein
LDRGYEKATLAVADNPDFVATDVSIVMHPPISHDHWMNLHGNNCLARPTGR